MSQTNDDVKTSVAAVFDRASETYDRTGVEFFGLVGRTLVELAGISPGERVLELGAGRGAATLPAAERVGGGGLVLATDLADGMVSRLRDDVERLGLDQVECRLGDAEAPDAEPDAWDVVLASLVLFFLPDLDSAVRAYRELLRPGGRLAFSWFAVEDTRWDPVFESLVAELPEEIRGQRRPGLAGPFSGPEAMDSYLREASYNPVTDVRPMTVRYADDATWWATLWSHGRRATMEKLQEHGVLESTMERLTAELDEFRADDGALEWRPGIGYTVAAR